MVVQVFADAGQVGDDVDPDGAKVVGGADPGEQKQLGDPIVPPLRTT